MKVSCVNFIGNSALKSNQRSQVNQSSVNNSQRAFGMTLIGQSKKALRIAIKNPGDIEKLNALKVKKDGLICWVKVKRNNIIDFCIYSGLKRVKKDSASPSYFISNILYN